MGALLLSLLLVQAAAEPAESFPFDASLQPVYARAATLLASGQVEQARPDVERLVREAPDNPRAWSLLGWVESDASAPKAQEAFQRALKHGLGGEERVEALLRLAMLSLKHSGASAHQAEDWMDEALKLEPDRPQTLLVGTVFFNASHDFKQARALVERLLRQQPDNAQAHALYAVVLANQDEVEAAARQVQLARQGGVQKEYFDPIERRAREARQTRWLWQIPLGLALVLGTALGLLFLAGTLLSWVQVKRLASVEAGLLRNEQTPQERWVDRLYNTVLWAGSLLFYASVPMTLVLSVAMAGGMLYGLFLLERVPVKLILMALVVGIGSLWAVLRGLFVSGPPEPQGRVLTEAEAPRLFAALTEVAGVARARRVDKVFLDPDAGIGVREAGGTWRVLLGRGEYVLHLGFAALRGLSVTELKAILAHEYGHFSHGETRLNPVIGRILTSTLHTLRGMAELGNMIYLSPAYWFLRGYFSVYLGVTRGHSRRRELLADRTAALVYGGDAFGTALTRAVHNADLYERIAMGTLVMLRRTGRPCHDLYRCLNAADTLTPESLRTLRSVERVEREVNKYDSHPPPHERVARVAGISALRPVEEASAFTLFEAPESLAQELTRALAQKVHDYLETRESDLPPVRTELEPALQEQFASALALHQDALELQQRGHPEADTTLVASARRMAETLGPTEPLLVPVLQDMAGAQSRQGHTQAAQASLQRAIGLLEAQPVRDQGRIDALKQQIENVSLQAAVQPDKALSEAR